MIAGFLICLALAAVIATVFCVSACIAAGQMAREEDARYARQRTPGMGDPTTVPERPLHDISEEA